MYYLVLLKILILSSLLQFCQGCPPMRGRTVEQVLLDNKQLAWLVLILDETVSTFNRIFNGVSYGTLIKPNLVLTSASALSNSRREDLKVIGNCNEERRIDCDTSLVLSFVHSKNYDENDVKESDWVILKLENSIDRDGALSVIRLAGENDDYDLDSCRIYRWRLVKEECEDADNYECKEEIEYADYRVSLTDSIMNEDDENQLIRDLDCFVEQCPLPRNNGLIKNTLSFLGSPIVCRLKNDDQDVQVGFSTWVYKVAFDDSNGNYWEKAKVSKEVRGSLQNVTDIDNFK